MKSQRKHKRLKEPDQQSAGKNEYVETREDYLVKGYNGLESAVIISDEFGSLWGRPKSLEREKVKFILSTLNERGVSYAIIGGIAMGQHALDATLEGVPIKVVDVRSLLILKMLAVPERTDLGSLKYSLEELP